MHSALFTVAALALLAVCACAPVEDAIQDIPKQEPIPSATGKENAESGAVVKVSGSGERHRRDTGLESDLLPSANDVDALPIGGQSQFSGHGRIRVLPAFLG